MKHFKIHIITAFLAGIIALPVMFSGGLQLFQAWLKYRVEHRMENETLQTLRFPLDQVKWMEEGREIMVGGQMYDLKSFHISGHWLIAEGFADHEETRVVQTLNHFNEKDQNRSILSVLMFGQFFIALFVLSIHGPLWTIITRTYRPYLVRVGYPHLQRFYPPPR